MKIWLHHEKSDQRQVIIWTTALLPSIRPLGKTNFRQIVFKIQTFSFRKMHFKMSSEKCRTFCLSLDVLIGGDLLSLPRDLNLSHQFYSLRQNGRYFPDGIFKYIFLNENVWILIKIPVKCVLKGPINNILTLFQIMAWRRPGDKPLSKTMMVTLLTHICVTRPQWVNP